MGVAADAGEGAAPTIEAVPVTLKARGVNVPALRVFCPRMAPYKGVVLACHGVTGKKEDLRPDYDVFARHGLMVVSIDAPHHGARRDAYFGVMMRSFEGKKYPRDAHRFWQHVDDATDEATELVRAVQHLSPGGVGWYGYSMGGMIGYTLAARHNVLRALVAVNASPDRWVWADTLETRRLIREAPLRRPEAVAPCAVLALNASRDEAVAAVPVRKWVTRARPLYRQFPERLGYHEYPNSPHWLTEPDWKDARLRAANWFARFLSAPPPA